MHLLTYTNYVMNYEQKRTTKTDALAMIEAIKEIEGVKIKELKHPNGGKLITIHDRKLKIFQAGIVGKVANVRFIGGLLSPKD